MRKQAITLEALEILDAIDQKGSFAGAAQVLYKVPSAISYSIQKIEQDLGVTLFTKQGRKSVLTPAGNVLLDQGRELLAAAQQLTETTREVHHGWETALNIAIDTSVGDQHLYSVINEFLAIKPDIEINLYQTALAGGWEMLTDTTVDLAIGLPPKPPEVSGINTIPYKDNHWVFAVSPQHPLAQLKRPLQADDIECHRNIVIRDSSLHSAKLTHRLFSKSPTLTVSTLREKIAAQKAGLGVGYLPKEAIQQEIALGELHLLELNTADDNHVSQHYTAWRKEKTGKALRWFIDNLSNSAVTL